MNRIDYSQLKTVDHPLMRPLLVITAPKGSLCCGYISIDALNRNGDAGATVTGTDNHEQMLDAKVRNVSDAGAKLGVKVGMSGQEALERFGATFENSSA
ncbi:MAG: DUF1805 domain-containing protein [Planctomycetota bacterium]